MILVLPVYYCALINCESFIHVHTCMIFVCCLSRSHSCVAPTFAFKLNKEVLDLTNQSSFTGKPNGKSITKPQQSQRLQSAANKHGDDCRSRRHCGKGDKTEGRRRGVGGGCPTINRFIRVRSVGGGVGGGGRFGLVGR